MIKYTIAAHKGLCQYQHKQPNLYEQRQSFTANDFYRLSVRCFANHINHILGMGQHRYVTAFHFMNFSAHTLRYKALQIRDARYGLWCQECTNSVSTSRIHPLHSC